VQHRKFPEALAIWLGDPELIREDSNGLGLSLFWDTDLGRSYVDQYTYSSEYIKAGTLPSTGILNSGVRTEADVAKGLIGEYVNNKSVLLKASAIMGLGLASRGQSSLARTSGLRCHYNNATIWSALLLI
jgi:26S proteasome regulatory subunit N1